MKHTSFHLKIHCSAFSKNYKLVILIVLAVLSVDNGLRMGILRVLGDRRNLHEDWTEGIPVQEVQAGPWGAREI